MKTGPEIDSLVHEKIFGHARHDTEKQGHLNVCKHCDNAFAVHWTKEQADARFCSEGAVPRYSTDIAAAWEVVEKLRRSFRVHLLTTETGFYVCDLFHFDIADGPEEEIPLRAADARTAPAAICYAALKAADALPG